MASCAGGYYGAYIKAKEILPKKINQYDISDFRDISLSTSGFAWLGLCAGLCTPIMVALMPCMFIGVAGHSIKSEMQKNVYTIEDLKCRFF